ncbi:MAG: SWIM zinc finger family protein [Cyclobacteriaceae bacterium]
MSTVFTTDEKDLKKFFETLAEDEIQDCCPSKVYYRGQEYYENDQVSSAVFNGDKTLLTGMVVGSEKYRVLVHLKDSAVHASCTCPYDSVCKHIIAVLLYASNESVNIDTAASRADIGVKEYLNSLSKGDLTDLVMKYAPEQYFTGIINSHSDGSDAQKIFKKAERGIQEIFDDHALLDSPHEFEDALMKEISKLSGLEKLLNKELEPLIVYIIEEVENAFDEGNLYDHYGDYNFEPPEIFYSFIANYASALNFKQKTEFLERIDKMVRQSSYTTFHGLYQIFEKVYNEEDLPHLKLILMDSYKDQPYHLVENYYRCVVGILSNDERKKILSVLKDKSSSHLTKLVELLNLEGAGKEGIEILRQWLSVNAKDLVEENIYFLYLDLLKVENFDLQEVAKESITRCPTCSMLQKIATLLPGDISVHEEILEKKNPGDLLGYLERSGRLSECLDLVKRNKHIWEDRVFDFYKMNKKEFPQDAVKYFCKMIDKNLEHTGDH